MLAFWRHGFDATGVAQLEAATGIGRQSLYATFGDKRSLFLKALDYYFNTVIEPGFVAILDAPGSARQNVLNVLQSWEVMASAPDFSGCLIGNSVAELSYHDISMAEVLRRKFELMESALIRCLRRGKRDGEMPKTLNTKVTAQSLLAMAQGVAVLARVNHDPAVVRNVVASAMALLG